MTGGHLLTYLKNVLLSLSACLFCMIQARIEQIRPLVFSIKSHMRPYEVVVTWERSRRADAIGRLLLSNHVIEHEKNADVASQSQEGEKLSPVKDEYLHQKDLH